MPITIRDARADDISAMARLLAQLFAIESDFVFREQAQKDGLFLLLHQAACLLVADEDGVVVGMVSVQPLISTAEGGMVGLLEDLVVDEAWREKGIGSLLLRAALDWAREQGLTRVQLLADRNNEAALQFYFRRSFQSTQLVCLRITH